MNNNKTALKISNVIRSHWKKNCSPIWHTISQMNQLASLQKEFVQSIFGQDDFRLTFYIKLIQFIYQARSHVFKALRRCYR